MSESTSTTSEEFLAVKGIDKSFGSEHVLRALDLNVRQGEFLTLLGPSGCGKTTLLRILAGFEIADRGRLNFQGTDFTHVPPERRPFNMVFQSYALFPHMTVRENVEYGLLAAGCKRGAAYSKVRDMLELVDIDSLEKSSVRTLSGGQQQRVALARALVNEPEILLLDEPLGALDLMLRKRLQDELRRIQARLATTFIFVTHDQDEALTMSQRIGVMEHGELVQLGTPQSLYDLPASRFVAEFIGDADLLPGEVIDANAESAAVKLDANGQVCTCRQNPADPIRAGDPAYAVVRPQHWQIDSDGAFRATLKETVFAGAFSQHTLDLGDGVIVKAQTGTVHDMNSAGAMRVSIQEHGASVIRRDPS